MRLRSLAFPFLMVLAAALPTLLSLCELRCVPPGAAPKSVPSEAATPACSGHQPESEQKRSNSSDSSHDCCGHALLAKNGRVTFGVELSRAFTSLALVAVAFVFEPVTSGLPTTASIFADLSPPSSRSLAVLRL